MGGRIRSPVVVVNLLKAIKKTPGDLYFDSKWFMDLINLQQFLIAKHGHGPTGYDSKQLKRPSFNLSATAPRG